MSGRYSGYDKQRQRAVILQGVAIISAETRSNLSSKEKEEV
ncbi:hypothetical protein [Lacrimispora sp. HJ-01]